jgi:hypothetical protein
MICRSALAVFALVMLCHGPAFSAAGPFDKSFDSCQELHQTICYTSNTTNPKYRWCHHVFNVHYPDGQWVQFEVQQDYYYTSLGDINAQPIWRFTCQNEGTNNGGDSNWIKAAGTCWRDICQKYYGMGKGKPKK